MSALCNSCNIKPTSSFYFLIRFSFVTFSQYLQSYRSCWRLPQMTNRELQKHTMVLYMFLIKCQNWPWVWVQYTMKEIWKKSLVKEYNSKQRWHLFVLWPIYLNKPGFFVREHSQAVWHDSSYCPLPRLHQQLFWVLRTLRQHLL